jgi:hypothetical protein
MSNICNCPKPPGGSVSCRDDQLAVCGYRNGEIVSGCFDPPGHAAFIADEREKNLIVANWVASTVTGAVRDDNDPIEPHLFEILDSGRYVDEATGEILNFTLPSTLDLRNIRIQRHEAEGSI